MERETAIILVPLLAALFLPVPLIAAGRYPQVRELWTFAVAGLSFWFVLLMLPAVLAGDRLVYSFGEVVKGVPLAFRVDYFGMLFALVASSLWILTSLYSIGYMRGLKEHSQTRFFCFFALALASTFGVAFSANLLTMYLFYECLSLSTFPLVTHHQDAEAKSGGRKYLTYILGTSVGLALPAMMIIYFSCGTLDFQPGGIVAGNINSGLGMLLFVMFIFGFAKAGVMPFHSWLPGAMVAPTPVSALLHAVAVVKVGVFSILRVVTGIFGPEFYTSLTLGDFSFRTLMCIIAATTVLVASMIAMSQDGLKRRLAFSTIGQLGYIVLGAMILSQTALMASMLHIVMHAFGKITLFMCAGAIFVATGKKYISQMSGIGRKMPFTMGAFAVASLSVIGLPPTGGFISKWFLLKGATEAADGSQLAFMVCYLISSLLAAVYLFPIIFEAFFKKSSDPQAEDLNIAEAPLCCVIPPVLTAFVSIVLFFCPGVFFELAEQAAELFFGKM